MPFLSITTNQAITPETRSHILQKLSAETANLLGKPENYVMTAWLPEASMTFGGQCVPTAYVELNSIGLTHDQATKLSLTICTTIAEHTDIPSNNIYIKFYNAPRELWGWDNKTFG